jgi:hypothetical protein
MKLLIFIRKKKNAYDINYQMKANILNNFFDITPFKKK